MLVKKRKRGRGGASGDVGCRLGLGVLHKLFEGTFFLEPCADAEGALGRDIFRVDRVSRDRAELGVSLADEVDDIQEIGHEALFFVTLPIGISKAIN